MGERAGARVRACVCVPNILPRGLRSPHAHLIDTGIDSSLGIPRQTVNRKRLENAKAGFVLVMDTFFFLGGGGGGA